MTESYCLNYIDGEYRDIQDQTFEVINPATEEPLARAPISDEAEVDLAVQAARRAFDDGPWPRMSAQERAAALDRVADLLEDYAENLAELEAKDTGMTLRQTESGHIPRAISLFRYFAGEAKRMTGETYPIDQSYLNVVLREPVGVAGLITPWNAPLPITAFKAAAALCVGNTCVVKPSEKAPMSVNALAQIMAEAELPPGVFNIVHGPGEPTGRCLVEHPGVDVIAFTGGSPTGTRILQASAAHIKRVGLELGGKSANIIFADADFERALDAALLMIFGSNGEACFSGSRILVERSIYDAFVDRFVERTKNIVVGDPFDETTEIGPLISQDHLKHVMAMLQRAQEQGAVPRCGGKRPNDRPRGYYLQPTVLTEVGNHMEIAREEVFGPVAVIMPFSSEQQAVAMANDSRYGLAGFVWSRDVERAMSVGQRIRAGAISINSPVIRDIRVPFGGYKHSGIGRMGGHFTIDLFTEVKATAIPIRPIAFPKMGIGN